MRKFKFGQAVCIITMFLLSAAIFSRAQTFTTVFDFNGTNGDGPDFLVQGNDGNIYGTTGGGGARNEGTVFRFNQDGTLTTLYSFCARTNCTDGEGPSSLVQTSDGSWFGVTAAGGFKSPSCGVGCGTFFQISPSGAFRLLHSFCLQTNCTDGYSPSGALIQGIDGKFYGTTAFGGAYNHGIVYSITRTGSLAVLYNFCPQTPNCVDGAEPYPGVIQANNGVLYGTTSYGGQGVNSSQGTIFQLTTAGKFTSLYSFSNNGRDSNPNGLIQGADGSLYGSSYASGTTGTVFQFTLGGKYRALHTFCLSPECADGGNPAKPLTQGSDGGLYGTTSQGAAGHGTIFEISPTGGFDLLYTFCSGSGGCTQSYGAGSPLIQSTTGLFYGTSSSLSSPDGTLYSLDMGLGPFVKTTPGFGKVGMTIGLLGNGLTGATSVTFNGTPATFAVVSDTYITATIPTGATSGAIEVATQNRTLSSNMPFRVLP